MAARCLLPGCGWVTGEPIEKIAGALVTWHVYEKHPDVWVELIGERPPADPDPRDPAVHQYLSARIGSN
jgi:hypothetical protein